MCRPLLHQRGADGESSVPSEMAYRGSPAVAVAAAGGGPAGLAPNSEAPATLQGFPTPKGYPVYGFPGVELGCIWKTRPVDTYVRMEREAQLKRELAKLPARSSAQSAGAAIGSKG